VSLSETIKLAFTATWAHKLRSALTLLGMIIGVTSVVLMVSLIQGFNAFVDEKIANISSKSFTVRRFDFADYRDTDTFAAALRRNKKLTMTDYEYLRSRATLIDEIGIQAPGTSCQVRRGAEILVDVPVDGMTANILEILHPDIAEGHHFTKAENDAGLRVAFVGADVAQGLGGGSSILNQEISISGIPYRVVGIANAQGMVLGQPQDMYITVTYKAYAKDFGDMMLQHGVNFVVTAKSDEVFDEATEEVRQLMRTRRGLRADEPDNFGLMTPDGIAGMRDRIMGPTYIVALVVPSIALLVGGIVIMNIMLVSVTERTREIGIRKALGARRRDILKQFLIEAVVLCTIGGVVSILIAWVGTRIITAQGYPTPLSLTAITVAITVSGAVGILSGFLPAWRASRLNPHDALQAE
jgi:putative ABC transport system permease protein